MCSKLILFVTVLVAISSILELCGAQRAYEEHTGTWNMQGASGGRTGNNKWITLGGILNLPTDADRMPISVFALQESGNIPGSTASPVRGRVTTRVGAIAGGERVSENDWRLGTRTRGVPDYHIYHCVIQDPRDPAKPGRDGRRTNLAIVSNEEANELILYRTNHETRPVLCIRIGTRFFCSIHANANNHNQAAATIHGLEEFFHQRQEYENQHYSWIIMGDYNRTPDEMRGALHYPPLHGVTRSLVHTTQPTQRGGRQRIIDYAIAGSTDNNNPDMRAALDRDRLESDHYGVRFYPAS